MTTYKSFSEAKIANPESEIVTTVPSWSCGKYVIGKFEALEPHHHLDGISGWIKCNPADYCVTVEKFLSDGHKFVDTDLVLGVDGKVWRESFLNYGSYVDSSKHFVLRAAALNQTETPEEKEAFDVMAQDNEAAEAKAVAEHVLGDHYSRPDGDAAFLSWIFERMVNVHGEDSKSNFMMRLNGIIISMRDSECDSIVEVEQPKPKHTKVNFMEVPSSEAVYYFTKTEDDMYVEPDESQLYDDLQDYINNMNECGASNLYRKVVTELTEREAFIDAACQVGSVNKCHPIIKLAEKMFDSCKFKLVA